MSQLEEIWKDLSAKGQVPVHRRVDETHPLDFYAGIEADGTRSLLLVGDSEPRVAERRFRAFELTTHRRTDGRWALTVHLRKNELARLFSHLCQDLVDSAREGCTRAESVAYVTNRILRW